jgi:hypothetical protein
MNVNLASSKSWGLTNMSFYSASAWARDGYPVGRTAWEGREPIMYDGKPLADRADLSPEDRKAHDWYVKVPE